MLFAHLKRILRLGRLRVRGPNGAKDESYWPPPPKICENWRSLSPSLRRSSPHKTKRQESAPLTALQTQSAGATTGRSSTKSTYSGHTRSRVQVEESFRA